jgi:hypothetical protein
MAPALALVVVMLFAGRTYIRVMYDGAVTTESAIEAASFAVQTVTTVGYGNWEKPAMQVEEPSGWKDRVLEMRGWSSVYMLLGATLYTLLTGVVVAIFLRMMMIG